MPPVLSPRYGFEIELLAPRGASRRDLAQALAHDCGGAVRRVFHHDTELSLVENRPVFRHLSIGFEVRDGTGDLSARLVDDVTISADLDAGHRPPAGGGWHRVLSDDARFLRLVDELCDPEATIAELLVPLATAFGVDVAVTPSGRHAVHDRGGATIAMAAEQPGERERVCEIITPPLDSATYVERLDRVLRVATRLDFVVPVEAAVHVHLDAEPFRDARRFGPLVRTFAEHRSTLWADLETNARCHRLGPLPAELVDLCRSPGFDDLPWADVQHHLDGLTLTKYCDLNLVNLRDRTPGKDTVEIRILPGSIDAAEISARVTTIERRLEHVLA